MHAKFEPPLGCSVRPVRRRDALSDKGVEQSIAKHVAMDRKIAHQYVDLMRAELVSLSLADGHMVRVIMNYRFDDGGRALVSDDFLGRAVILRAGPASIRM